MWQYAQFSCQEDLPIIMIQEFARLIAPKNQVLTKKAPDAVKSIAMTGVDSIIGSRMSNHAGLAIDELYRILGVNVEDKSLPVYLKRLKGDLQKAIDTCLKSEGKERIVVFIDDLDRVNAASALLILESLKNYMDCRHCVFVIALDYDAIVDGVKSKYALSIAKSKQYFDKIIQVNYHMPISQYNLSNLISEGINMLSTRHYFQFGQYNAICTKMVTLASGKNPRAIKKLFNTISLHCLTNKRTYDDPYENTIIFSLVCLEVFYYTVYKDIENNLLHNRFNIVRHILNAYGNLEINRNDSELEKIVTTALISADKIDMFIDFFHTFIKFLSNGALLSDSQLEVLKNIIAQSSAVDIKKYTTNKIFAFNFMKTLSFCEGHGIDLASFSFIKEWALNNKKNELSVSVGIDNIGEEVFLDITDLNVGPNILIGGHSGSGKTEFLRTYLLGLVCHYSPNKVNFIIIDFKGGGVFRDFSALPHVQDIVTTQDDLYSCEKRLREEIVFRAKVLQEAGVRNTKEYWALESNASDESILPEIILIIDELSVIKSRHPDLIHGLMSSILVGYSLGFHAIIATQSPSGVVDDTLWSMCNSKIAFSQSREDSNDLIKSEKAATLSRPGEAILSNWGQPRQFQTYYSEKEAKDVIEKILLEFNE